jgi:hypothetical protein
LTAIASLTAKQPVTEAVYLFKDDRWTERSLQFSESKPLKKIHFTLKMPKSHQTVSKCMISIQWLVRHTKKWRQGVDFIEQVLSDKM